MLWERDIWIVRDTRESDIWIVRDTRESDIRIAPRDMIHDSVIQYRIGRHYMIGQNGCQK